ncbi:MAG TPA: D-aminoacyl-tRNA deacylase [Candidatus Nitrosotenuis sp.]|nr:D-aminoacyl-tRNA deacylase [Candidatus Nitrosotenuis sp.]
MELLVAYEKDPAGSNMAKFLSTQMQKDGEVYRGKKFDLVIIPSPAISADWLEQKYHYDGFVFLSKHAAQSGELALTCHSTGNFSEAQFGGNSGQVAVPHPHLQKSYLQKLWQHRNNFSEFQITIEATHHGPTALSKPTLFIEIGTTEKEWTNEDLCDSVAKIVFQTMSEPIKKWPVAICFGGTHYPDKFTKEILHGEHALGTVVPKHALEFLDRRLFSHIIEQNKEAKTALLDWAGLGPHKQKILELLKTSDLEVVKL